MPSRILSSVCSCLVTSCLPLILSCHSNALHTLAPNRKGDEELDPEQIRKDIERLELIKKRRCVRVCTVFCAVCIVFFAAAAR